MISNTEKGNQLRDAVFNLLRAAGKRNLDREKPCDGKNVDVYYEDLKSFNRIERIGVECKNLDHSLTRDDFNKIFTEYNPIKNANGVDTLIIVTNSHTAPGVGETISKYDWIIHLTYKEFAAEIMDFDLYLRSMQALNHDKGLSEYYIPIKNTDGQDMFTVIDEWVKSDDMKPRDIQAGYGMGKTSFARHLTSIYAMNAESDFSHRIPIYLELGGIHNKQSIDSLICKYFTSDYQVAGFTYELFKELNRQGRFLIILDGFDEMKHGMTAQDFEYNFDEIDKLLEGRSKVLILGRPSAFKSDKERDSVLHGMEYIGDRGYKNIEKRNYVDIFVGSFDHEQTISFVTNYLQYLKEIKAKDIDVELSEEFVQERAQEILALEYEELISKPVHAKMLCSLAMTPDELLSELSRYDLYSRFIIGMYKREYSKPARKGIDVESRYKFIQKVAWSTWTGKGSSDFTYDEINEIDFSGLVYKVPNKDILREFVTGSILERKSGGLFYFAHRSFQEFLVAETLVSNTWSPKDIPKISRVLNEEIVQFVEESNMHNVKHGFAENIMDVLCLYKGEISRNLYKLLIEHAPDILPKDMKATSVAPLDINPWQMFIFGRKNPAYVSIAKPSNIQYYSQINDINLKYALLVNVILRQSDEYRKFAVGLLLRECMPIIVRFRTHKGGIKANTALQESHEYEWMKLLLVSVKIEFSEKHEPSAIIFNSNVFMQTLCDLAKSSFYAEEVLDYDYPVEQRIQLRDMDAYLKNADIESRDIQKYSKSLRNQLVEYFRAKPNMSQLVPVHMSSNKPARTLLSLNNSE